MLRFYETPATPTAGSDGERHRTFAYVSEAQRMGVKIRPPDVNYSDIRWKGNTGNLRVGLLSIKHVSTHTNMRIVTARGTGPYGSITDFLERVQPDDREARSLIFAGAFGGLHPKASRAEWIGALKCEVVFERALSNGRRTKDNGHSIEVTRLTNSQTNVSSIMMNHWGSRFNSAERRLGASTPGT